MKDIKLTPSLRCKLAYLVVQKNEESQTPLYRKSSAGLKGYSNKRLIKMLQNTLLDLVEPTGEIKKEYKAWSPESRKFYFRFYLDPLLAWFELEYGFAYEIILYLCKIVDETDSTELSEIEREGAEMLFRW